jgi:hypothetical protein
VVPAPPAATGLIVLMYFLKIVSIFIFKEKRTEVSAFFPLFPLSGEPPFFFGRNFVSILINSADPADNSCESMSNLYRGDSHLVGSSREQTLIPGKPDHQKLRKDARWCQPPRTKVGRVKGI